MESRKAFEYLEPEFSSCSFAIFEELRARKELCDVIIKAGSVSIPAHRLVLAATIPYFRAMFKCSNTEDKKRDRIIENVEPIALQCLIDFAYGCKLCITPENVEVLLETSASLQMGRAINACFLFLKDSLSFDTVLTTWEFADRFGQLDGKKIVDHYVLQNFEEFSTSEKFLSIPFTTLKDLISRDDLFATTEEVVFDAVLMWVKASEAERRPYLQELLPHIRISLLKPDYLTRHIQYEELNKETSPWTGLLDKINNRSSLPSQERCCSEKQHLKCSRRIGSSLFAVVKLRERPLKAFEQIVIRYYDGMNEKWADLCGFPKMKGEIYTCCTQEKLYFINSKRICTISLSTLECMSEEGPYDIPSLAGFIFHSKKLYFFGGGGQWGDKVLSFSPEQSKFSNAGYLLFEHRNVSVVSLENDFYIIGGSFLSPNRRSVEKFNLVTGLSVEIPLMLKDRLRPACAALRDKVYVFGGMDLDLTRLFSAEVYNPSTNTWIFIADINFDLRSLVLYSGRLHAFAKPLEDEVLIYDPDHDEWELKESMSCPNKKERLLSVFSSTTIMEL